MLDNAESQEKGYGRDGAERYRKGVHREFYLDCDSGHIMCQNLLTGTFLNVCMPSTVQYDSTVKSNCFSCRGPEFGFQFPCWVVSPLGDLTPSSGLSGCNIHVAIYVRYVHTSMHNKK